MNLRVLYFSERCTIHDERFLNALIDAGAQVAFAHLYAGAVPTYLSTKIGLIENLGFDSEFDWQSDSSEAASRFGDMVDKYSPDVINAGPITSCGYIAATSNAPLLLTSWGSDLLYDIDQEEAVRTRAKLALESAQWLAVDTKAGLSAASLLAGTFSDRSTIFPWGVDLTLFGSVVPELQLVRDMGWDENTIVFTNRGWTSTYDIPTVLKGFAIALERDESLRLILANDGPLHAQIEQLILELNISDFVVKVGRITSSETAKYLSISDLYVSAAISDGTSISLLEAMAGGVPPIVTNIESNREWVVDDQTGFTFETGNAGELADTLNEANENPSLLKKISSNVRRTAIDRADWKVNQLKFTDAVKAAAQG